MEFLIRGLPEAARLSRDIAMKHGNFENGLAVLGALIVLLGVSAAAGSALAADHDEVTATAVAIHEAQNATLAAADEANALAADIAVNSLALTNLVDLDIELEDRTSTLVSDAG